MTFALGRGLERSDRAAVDEIVGRLARDDYRFETLVNEIVSSQQFRMRTKA
jgi:hypothetical protein